MTYELGTIKVEAELHEEDPGTVESLQDVVARYDTLGEEQKEHFYALFLNNANTVIGDKLIGLGSRDQVQFDISDLVRTAALVNAGAVIIIHNHPSGKPGPTDQDIEATRGVGNAMDTLGVKLLDHVIVTRTESYSMKQHGCGPF